MFCDGNSASGLCSYHLLGLHYLSVTAGVQALNAKEVVSLFYPETPGAWKMETSLQRLASGLKKQAVRYEISHLELVGD